jgi:hypothetical protein
MVEPRRKICLTMLNFYYNHQKLSAFKRGNTVPSHSFHTNINYFRGTVKKKNF